MTYSAMEVAKFTLDYCVKKGRPISNLKLQKLLFFLWKDYFAQTRSHLFRDEICAWKLGPVVPSVYYEYCAYAGSPIRREYATLISEDDRAIMVSILDKYREYSARELVDMTHEEGTAWHKAYRRGLGDRSAIPFEAIAMEA